MKESKQGSIIKNISGFFEVVLGLATMFLFIICLVPLKFLGENISLIMEVAGLLIIAIIIWQNRAAGKSSEKITRLSKEEEGSIDYELFYKLFRWSLVIFFAFCAIAAVILWIFRKELWLAIQNNSLLTAALFSLALIIVWRIKAENKKEHQERRLANKILEDQGLEPLKEQK